MVSFLSLVVSGSGNARIEALLVMRDGVGRALEVGSLWHRRCESTHD
jgi:hypothetical protein